MTTEVQPTGQLGEQLRVAGFCCRGEVGLDRLVQLAKDLVGLVGMTTAGMLPQVWTYPLPDGKGGEGQTVCQPLVESLLAFDTWPALSSGPRVYVILASCRPFDLDVVADFLAGQIGEVIGSGYFQL